MPRMKLPRPLLFALFIAGIISPAPTTQRVSAQTPYRILVTNDDGVNAPGILAIARALKDLGEVSVVAPSENQSGKGHSISITDPVYVDAVTIGGDIKALSATATPASCVRIALKSLLRDRPNLIVSGINRGYNLGIATYVSGTVGAAREGALSGIPAIASSMDVRSGWNDYAEAAKYTAQLAAMVKESGLPDGVYLNVNVPAGTPKGLRVAAQSRLGGTEGWVEAKTPRGRRLFWNTYEEPEKDVPGTDVSATADGYVAVVALKASEYDAATTEKLKTLMK
jgi:5'/3'-nucleotidase